MSPSPLSHKTDSAWHLLSHIAHFSGEASQVCIWCRDLGHTAASYFLRRKESKLPFYPREAAAATAAKSLQSCPTLCDPIDGSLPGSPIPGILQARILEWVAISFSNSWKAKSESEVAQSCSTLSDPMDCSLPGSSIHGILQARVLEWGAIAFSKGKQISSKMGKFPK